MWRFLPSQKHIIDSSRIEDWEVCHRGFIYMHKMQREIEIVSFETFLNTDLLSDLSKFLSKKSRLDCFQVPPHTSAALFLCLYLFVSLSQRTSPPRESQFPSALVLGLLFLPFHNFMFNFNVSVVRPISSRFTSPPAEFLRPLCDLHIFVKFAKQNIPYPR